MALVQHNPTQITARRAHFRDEDEDEHRVTVGVFEHMQIEAGPGGLHMRHVDGIVVADNRGNVAVRVREQGLSIAMGNQGYQQLGSNTGYHALQDDD